MFLPQANLLLYYDGSFEGFLCAVFDAYALHCTPADVAPGVDVQPQLGQQVREVATDLSHAERVKLGLVKHGGVNAYEKVKTAFLADVPGR